MHREAEDVMIQLKENVFSSKTVVRPQEFVTDVLSNASLQVRGYLPEDSHLKRLIRMWNAKAKGGKEPITRSDINLNEFKNYRGDEFIDVS
ncbi:unnamed protein product [Orchesella dallaii]|uniref:Uncharacterized protein n=1 Tax=Orchesella dallaii TaxID=48710 RepID=A0ABP1Q741_9HEXA